MAVQAGAQYIGLVFYPRSPRYVSLSKAVELVDRSVFHSDSVKRVGVFVDPSDTLLKTVLSQVKLDILQLHGSESPQRLAFIREYFGLPILKAYSLRVQEDLEGIVEYLEYVDYLLFDTKPPSTSHPFLPGGNGIPFDWSLLKDLAVPCRWFLSGGLNPDNLAQAVSTTHAKMVDVSSGVEDRPGHKNQQKIQDFLTKASTLS